MEIKKTLLTFLSILFCAVSFAQNVPQGINYQALARKANGAVLMNQALTIQFSIISDVTIIPPTISWQETHPNWGSSGNTTLQITRISNE